MRGFWSLVLAFTLVGGIAPAYAGLNFDFSFSNVSGNVSGTVTGEIFGLTNNATSAATDIVIDSFPAGLFHISPPWDIFNSGLAIGDNSFTVTNGVITGAGFNQAGPTAVFDIDFFGGTKLKNNIASDEVVNNTGLAGITFAPLSNIPEPVSITLLLSGLVGIGLARRRQDIHPLKLD